MSKPLSDITPEIEHVRNIKPKGRKDITFNKDKFEKNRLKERTFGHVRYESNLIDNPIIADRNGLSYTNEIDRFTLDFNEQQKNDKQNKIKKHEKKIKKLKIERDIRHNKRIELMNNQFEYKEKQIKQKQETMLNNPFTYKNGLSMPYDPITLKYNDGIDGQRLYFQDKRTIWRAKLRQKMLFEKSNSGFDPITGQPKQFTGNIIKPQTPPELKNVPK